MPQPEPDMCLVSEGETWKGVSVLSPPVASDDRQDRFQAIYQACHAAVLGYVVRRTASPEDAADVMAETFLTCWRRLAEVPPGPEARLWLFGVARRTLANHHRGERRRLALADRLRDDLVTAYRPPQHTAQESRIAAASCSRSTRGRAWTTGRSRSCSAAPAIRSGFACTGPGSGWKRN